MPDSISQPNSNSVNSAEVGTWQYPVGAFDAPSPAVEAFDNFQQHRHVDYLAADPAPQEIAQQPSYETAVNRYETVPEPDEIAAYATSVGKPIDPYHAESALRDAQAIFTAAEAEDQAAARRTPEHLAAATERAAAFGAGIEAMRERILVDVGMQGSALRD